MINLKKDYLKFTKGDRRKKLKTREKERETDRRFVFCNNQSSKYNVHIPNINTRIY